MRFLQQLLPPHTHTQHVPTADVVVRSLTEADPFAYLVVNDLHVTHPHTHTHTHIGPVLPAMIMILRS